MAATVKDFLNNSPPQCEDVDLNGYKEENNNLILSAGISLSDSDHTQTSKSIAEYSAHGDFYTDTGAANAYVLSAQGSKYPTVGYEDGMRVRFWPANTNDGSASVTVNVSGHGVKDVKQGDAAAYDLVHSDIIVGQVAELVYSSASDVFFLQMFGKAPTATFRSSFRTSEPGWLHIDGGAIGNAASGASTLARADAWALFEELWNNVTDAWAPVSGGRGASAAADFAANKTLGLTRTWGRAIGGAGAGSGLTARALGEYMGGETHAISESEMPSHRHTVRATSVGGNQASPLSHYPARDDSGKPWDSTSNGTMNSSMINTTGSGTAHTNMQPSTFVNWFIKL